jgi:hypothetical protein
VKKDSRDSPQITRGHAITPPLTAKELKCVADDVHDCSATSGLCERLEMPPRLDASRLPSLRFEGLERRLAASWAK